MDITLSYKDSVPAPPVSFGQLKITLPQHACHLCSFKSDWASSLKVHLKNIHYNPKKTTTRQKIKGTLYCHHCKYKTEKRKNLISHMYYHINVRPYSCEFCAYTTRSPSCWKSHLKKHFGIGMHTCETCGYSTQSQGDLKKHIRVHTGERPFVCNICSVGFTIKSNLIIHMRKHTGDRPFKCNLCSYKTGRKGDLTSHMKSHSDEKPYSCLCGFKTARSGHLKRHLLIHSKDDNLPFRCKLCKKKFPTLEERNLHELSHEVREKNVPCPQCDFKTFNAKLLKKHVENIHEKFESEDSNEFGCPHCTYVGKDDGKLTRHLNRFHSSIIIGNCTDKQGSSIKSTDENSSSGKLNEESDSTMDTDPSDIPLNLKCYSSHQEDVSIKQEPSDNSSGKDKEFLTSENYEELPA